MKFVYLTFLLCSSLIYGKTMESTIEPFEAEVKPIPPDIKSRVKKYTWHTGCPIELEDLRYIKMKYWGFDHHPHMGSILINKSLAREVIEIFAILYKHHFPIERMELMNRYKSNDDASMLDNNTSAFNCRDLTGFPGLFSQHSYGRAIDINPKINPYVKGAVLLPSNAFLFMKNTPIEGKITKNSLIYKLFTEHGWDWGGNWYDTQDYQHFEKRKNGEKRNPYGYSLCALLFFNTHTSELCLDPKIVQ